MKINKTKNQWQRKLLVLIGGCLLAMMQVAIADIAVIVNPVNGGVTLTRSDIQEIFLGVQGKLPNGASVYPVDQAANQPIRQRFYELVAGKSPVQMQSYWSRLIFTGKGNPPQVLSNGEAVMSHVASNKNAIGYIDASTAKGSSGISTVFVIPTQ